MDAIREHAEQTTLTKEIGDTSTEVALYSHRRHGGSGPGGQGGGRGGGRGNGRQKRKCT